MNRLQWPSSTHVERVQWLAEYDRWRRRHAQRWPVQRYAGHIMQLNTMVDECHAFMQNMVNNLTTLMHGAHAVKAFARKTTWCWHSIQCQMMGHA